MPSRKRLSQFEALSQLAPLCGDRLFAPLSSVSFQNSYMCFDNILYNPVCFGLKNAPSGFPWAALFHHKCEFAAVSLDEETYSVAQAFLLLLYTKYLIKLIALARGSAPQRKPVT